MHAGTQLPSPLRVQDSSNGATQWTGPPTSINEIKLSPNGRTSTEACLSGGSMFCQVDNQQEPSDPAMI